MIEPGQDYLLFDGDCGICSYSSEIAARIDQQRRFIIQPYQSVPEAELQLIGLGYQECDAKVQVITRKGRIYSGAFAVNYFFWQRPLGRLFVLAIYLIPILLIIEVTGYALVARNRQRISQWFGLKACLLRR